MDIQESLDSLDASIDRILKQKDAMLAVLKEVEEYLDDRADADDGIPNEAMRLLIEVRAAIRS